MGRDFYQDKDKRSGTPEPFGTPKKSFAPDYIFFGGNRLILNPLIQESKYLQTKASRISPRILDVRYADREALAGSLAEITRSLVFTF